MNLQILVATMHRKDFSLADEMNIRCDAIFANQANQEAIETRTLGTFEQKMITTSTRGVGLNRNIALLAATADIVLFADDDVVYHNDMPQQVLKAFAENSKADIIVFGMDMMKDGEIYDRRRCRNARLHVWNAMRYGTYRVAAKRHALIDTNITFHQRFGGGCEFSSGEDSLFLKECFDRGLKVYSHDYSLGTCCKDQSSWFTGCNEKYFYDKGILIRHLFPKTAYFMGIYFGICFKRETEIDVCKRLRLIYSGIRHGKSMVPYKG